ncbi:MAG UNVERIFIED_CONTAM: hypothetical protein LVT10_17955 [Anaerolineae bacterium]
MPNLSTLLTLTQRAVALTHHQRTWSFPMQTPTGDGLPACAQDGRARGAVGTTQRASHDRCHAPVWVAVWRGI